MNLMKLIAFDLETAEALPAARPGISCAALAPAEMDTVRVWSRFPRLTQAECREIVQDLQRLARGGYVLLSWNGLGFDFRILAEESGLYVECGKLALDHHVDLMLLVTFQRGHYLSLQAALEGAGLGGKLKRVRLSDGSVVTDMDGAKAPALWAAGEHEAVLAYLCHDVSQILALSWAIERDKAIRWISSSGNPQAVQIDRLLLARECFALPEPDVSWMANPPTRQQFVSWIPIGVLTGLL